MLAIPIKAACLAAGITAALTAAIIFASVAAAQVVMEYVVQPTQAGRTARDWRDALAGILGGAVAAFLAI